MSLWGHPVIWWVLVAWIGLVAVFVVFSIGFFCCADRWCDRRKAGPPRRTP
jgi:hypothetical protein